MIEIIYSIILIILFIFLKALFTSSEMSFVSTNKIKLETNIRNNVKNAKLVGHFIKKPQNLFGTTLVGNNLCTVAAAQITSYLISEKLNLPQLEQTIVSTLIITPVILLFGEITPMSLGREFSNVYPYKIAPFIYIANFILKPLAFISSNIALFLGKILSSKKIEKSNISRDELRILIDEINKRAEPQKEIKLNMLKEVIDFSETTVKEIMIPLTNATLINAELTKEEILKIFNSTKYDKIPVYKYRIDNIIGFLNITDFWRNINNNKKIDEYLIKPPFYVPLNRSIDDLLKDLQEKGRTSAIVVDEFGSIVGIVYYNDIVSEVIYELKTFTKGHKVIEPLKKINEYSYEIDGNYRIAELNEELNLNLPEEEHYTTINGFIIHLIERIPQQNEIIAYENYLFTVIKSSDKKID
ncbi:MAG TPA: hemolysin family protein, partial [bacterium]|nr:hemolysin family protein [bacterium]